MEKVFELRVYINGNLVINPLYKNIDDAKRRIKKDMIGANNVTEISENRVEFMKPSYYGTNKYRYTIIRKNVY